MTLDKQPFVSSDVRPLRVSSLPIVQDVKHQEDEVPQQWNPDMKLYADYEMMYSQASEEAHEATADVIASQRYVAYLTELARRLCEMGVPEEETFLHIHNHHAYKSQYDELTSRAIVSAVFTEEKPRRQQETDSVSRATRRLVDFLSTRYVFRYNTALGYTEY